MRKLYLAGSNIAYSRSPLLHGAALVATGLDWSYSLLSVNNFAQVVDRLRASDCAGANVTIPFKRSCREYLDSIDPDASLTGAVNTIVKVGPKLRGCNTDVSGLKLDLERVGLSLSGKEVLILGAGGGAAAVLAALDKPAALSLVCRNREQGLNLAGRLGHRAEILPWNLRRLPAADLIFVCTPPGVWRHWTLKADIVYNLNYHEPELAGLRYYNGLGMLVFQAALSFELWTGIQAPLNVMAAAVNLKLTP